ncbi:uncharacterized protein LOC143470567 [Clavelina lepadiformis]|uniref:uncharacterized protein LOC143470567 n=1 Tax=Clavelina lepadiformis TaxID=159417 RepID=UPI0040438164
MGDQHEAINPGLGMRVCLAGIRKRFSTAPQMSTEEFYSMWIKANNRDTLEAEKVLLLDIRKKEEYEVSKISGAVWINAGCNLEENMTVVNDLIKQNSNTTGAENLIVVAYCSLGYRSSQLIGQLKEKKMQMSGPHLETVKFYNLEGSIFKWANENKPLVLPDNTTSTSFVHPFNSLWGKLLREGLHKRS